jgi:predicted RNase H-like HicB family nuclease
VSQTRKLYHVRIHSEPGQQLWAEVAELPGCFASGRDLDELDEALAEAISLYLSEPGRPVHVQLENADETEVTERRIRVTC